MPTLLPELEAYVQQKLDSGQFNSRDDLIRETLEVYREIDRKQTELRQLIAERIAQADRGEVEPMDIAAIKARLIERFHQREVS